MLGLAVQGLVAAAGGTPGSSLTMGTCPPVQQQLGASLAREMDREAGPKKCGRSQHARTSEDLLPGRQSHRLIAPMAFTSTNLTRH